MSQPRIAVLSPVVLALCLGCSASEPSESVADAAPADAMTDAPSAMVMSAGGTVIETMDAAGYTYVLVDTGDDQLWAAAPWVDVEPGATVAFESNMPMDGYRSQTLGRTFERVYFAEAIEVLDAGSADVAAVAEGGPGAAPAGSAGGTAAAGGAAVGELTIEQVFARRGELVGRSITLSGEVVKFNAAIMGTNWLHIQDGTGGPGTDDLTITTPATVAVGDQVTVTGVLVADRDFGAGYVYDLIIEGAEVVAR